MPVFFFDTFDGEIATSDTTGLTLKDVSVAKAEAVRALPDMAKERLPDGDQREFVVSVRDEAGQTLLRATLSLRVEDGSGT